MILLGRMYHIICMIIIMVLHVINDVCVLPIEALNIQSKSASIWMLLICQRIMALCNYDKTNRKWLSEVIRRVIGIASHVVLTVAYSFSLS